MKDRIRLIATDLDGTLLDEQNEVSAATAEAVRLAAEAGVLVVPTTGRQLAAVPRDVLSLPGVTYAVTSNGAKVYNVLTNKTLISNCIDRKTAIKLLEQIEQFDYFVGAYIDGQGYMQKGALKRFKNKIDDVWYRYFANTRNEIDDFAAFVAQQTSGVEKFTLNFSDAEERMRAKVFFEANDSILTTASSNRNIELNAKTAHKGNAVMALAGLLGIEKAQVMAMGDSHNDVEMMQAVGYPVAMGNAEDEVKALAAHVTLPNWEDGAAVAILGVL